MPYVGGASSDNYIGNVPTTGGITVVADGAAGVDGAAGGTATITASSAITAGDLVGLNTDGTAGKIGQLIYSGGEVRAPIAGGGNDLANATVATDGSGTYLFVYTDTAASSYVYAVAATYSGGAFTFGSAVALSTNAAHLRANPRACWDATSSSFNIIYGLNSNPNHVVACTVSGTTITMGTSVQIGTAAINSENSMDIAHDPDSGRNVAVFCQGTDVYIRSWSVSGTTITLGTAVQVNTAASANLRATLAYDTTNNQFLVAYYLTDQTIGTKIATVSGTTFTLGTEGSFDVDGAVPTNSVFKLFYSSTKDLFVLLHTETTGGMVFASVIQISGTSMLYGYEYDHAIVGAQGGTSLLYATSNGDNDFYVVSNTTTNYGGLNYISKFHILDSTSVTVAQPIHLPLLTVDTGSASIRETMNLTVCYDSGSDSLTIGACMEYTDGTYNVDEGMYAWNIDLTTFERYSNFLGIAAQDIADTATGTVTVIGGVNEKVSGLTTGRKYHIDPETGDLSEKNNFIGKSSGTTTAANFSQWNSGKAPASSPVGFALSATKLLVTRMLNG